MKRSLLSSSTLFLVLCVLACASVQALIIPSSEVVDVSLNEPLDAATGAVIQVEYEHHEIHAGSHFYVCNFEVVDEDDSIDFSFTTPDSLKQAHMTFLVSGTSRVEFMIYENVTASDGTITYPFNNNRNSLTQSVNVLRYNPTISVLGNLIYAESSGLEGATPSKATSSGLVSREREIILGSNNTYLFRITSRSDGNIISYCGEWYEHTDRS